jgi:hypothetical protein
MNLLLESQFSAADVVTAQTLDSVFHKEWKTEFCYAESALVRFDDKEYSYKWKIK